MLSLGRTKLGFGTNRSIEMIKILVTSTIEMTEQEFFAYAQSINIFFSPRTYGNHFADVSKMVIYLLTSIFTRFFCFINNSFKVSPLCIIKQGLQITSRPTFYTFVFKRCIVLLTLAKR